MGQTIPINQKVCGSCKNYQGVVLIKTDPQLESHHSHKCRAFDRIPYEIVTGKNDHKKNFPGDRGIKFEKKEGSK